MANELNDSLVNGVILLSTIGAVGLGLWAGSVGVTLFSWVGLIILLSLVVRR